MRRTSHVDGVKVGGVKLGVAVEAGAQTFGAWPEWLANRLHEREVSASKAPARIRHRN